MMQEQATLLFKARDNVRGANALMREGLPDIAASRAYYAMSSVAQAFLLGDGMAFSKHSGVIAAFGQHFANVGSVPREFHRMLMDAQELRNEGDYGRERTVTVQQAEAQIAYAEQFLAVAEREIGPLTMETG